MFSFWLLSLSLSLSLFSALSKLNPQHYRGKKRGAITRNLIPSLLIIIVLTAAAAAAAARLGGNSAASWPLLLLSFPHSLTYKIHSRTKFLPSLPPSLPPFF